MAKKILKKVLDVCCHGCGCHGGRVSTISNTQKALKKVVSKVAAPGCHGGGGHCG